MSRVFLFFSEKFQHLLFLIIILGIIYVIIFSSNITLTFSEDTYLQYIPYKEYIKQCYKDRTFPYFNMYMLNGIPLHATGQFGVVYPISRIFETVFPIHIAINLQIIFHLLLACSGVYLIVYFITKNPLSSFTSALILLTSSFFIDQIRHLPILAAASWYPLIIYGMFMFFSKHYLLGGCITTIAIFMQSTTFHPQITVYSFLSLGLALIGWIGIHKNIKTKEIISFIGIVIGSICIASIQLLPSFEILHYSSRVSISENIMFKGSLHPFYLILWFFPKILGYPSGVPYPYKGYLTFGEQSVYISIFVIISLLTLPKLKESSEKRTIKYFITLWLITLVFSMGRYSPFKYLIEVIPFINNLRLPIRINFISHIYLAIIGGVFFKYLDLIKVRSLFSLCIFMCFLLLGGFILKYFNIFQMFSHVSFSIVNPAIYQPFIIIGILSSGVVLYRKKRFLSYLIIWFAVLLEIYFFSEYLAQKRLVYKKPIFFKKLYKIISSTEIDQKIFLCFRTSTVKRIPALASSWWILYKLHTINGYDPFHPHYLQQELNFTTGGIPRFPCKALEIILRNKKKYGVKYIIWDRNDKSIHKIVKSKKDIFIVAKNFVDTLWIGRIESAYNQNVKFKSFRNGIILKANSSSIALPISFYPYWRSSKKSKIINSDGIICLKNIPPGGTYMYYAYDWKIIFFVMGIGLITIFLSLYVIFSFPNP